MDGVEHEQEGDSRQVHEQIGFLDEEDLRGLQGEPLRGREQLDEREQQVQVLLGRQTVQVHLHLLHVRVRQRVAVAGQQQGQVVDEVGGDKQCVQTLLLVHDPLTQLHDHRPPLRQVVAHTDFINGFAQLRKVNLVSLHLNKMQHKRIIDTYSPQVMLEALDKVDVLVFEGDAGSGLELRVAVFLAE